MTSLDMSLSAPSRHFGVDGRRLGRVVSGPARRRLRGAAFCPGLGAVPPGRRTCSEQPVRLTQRGQAVAALAGIAAGCLLGMAAWISAPSGAPAGPHPATVVVHAGDTLWSIAGRVAPGADPRQEVADLVRINGLSDVTVFPGQTLRTR